MSDADETDGSHQGASPASPPAPASHIPTGHGKPPATQSDAGGPPDHNRRVADWTARLTIVTFVLAFIGCAQLAAGILQWLSMRDQVQQARDSSIDTERSLLAADRQANLAADANGETQSIANEANKRTDIAIKLASSQYLFERRPRVGVVGGQLDGWSKDDIPSIKITYANFGRAPALDLTTTGGGSEFYKNYLQDPKYIAGMRGPIRKACEQISPSLEGDVAYPNTGNTSYSEFPTPRGRFSMDAINTGQDIIMVTGCFAYTFEGKPHRSGYCLYYDAKAPGAPNMNFCPAGNFSD